MNMWAGYPDFLDFLAEDFKNFLENVEEVDLKSVEEEQGLKKTNEKHNYNLDLMKIFACIAVVGFIVVQLSRQKSKTFIMN